MTQTLAYTNVKNPPKTQEKDMPVSKVTYVQAMHAGVLMSKTELQRARKLCEQAGAWLIVDNTYEHFTYDGRQHTCVSGPHVVNIFSMSKVRECKQGRLEASGHQ